MSHKTRHTCAVLIEGGVGALLVIAGLGVVIFTRDWMVAFWLVTVGAACVGHAVTFGLGLLDRPFLWSTSRGKRPRGF
jgi:hypothetical protein